MTVRRILFVTWDGPQVSYLEGLFVPIFKGLMARGYQIAVLQFGWGETNGQLAKDACLTAGIQYRRVEVERRLGGAGAFLTALRGGGEIDRAVLEWDIELLFPRSLLAAFALLRSRSSKRLPILFDADGLPADERVEFGGLSCHGPTYRLLRKIEARTLAIADHVLVRTKVGAEVLAGRSTRLLSPGHFTVVHNPRPLPPPLPSRGWRTLDPDSPRLVYVGSLGPQYLPREMLELSRAIRRRLPGLTLDLFTGDREAAMEAIEAAGLADAAWVRVDSLPPAAVATRLTDYDAGLALRASSLSMRAVAPIKLGDYLMAGLPIIGSAAAGDGAMLRDKGVLFAVEGEADADLTARWLVETVARDRDALRSTCRALGELHYSLNRAINLYDQAIVQALARIS